MTNNRSLKIVLFTVLFRYSYENFTRTKLFGLAPRTFYKPFNSYQQYDSQDTAYLQTKQIYVQFIVVFFFFFLVLGKSVFYTNMSVYFEPLSKKKKNVYRNSHRARARSLKTKAACTKTFEIEFNEQKYTRFTVRRRRKGFNAPVSTTFISRDFFLSNCAHNRVDYIGY